MILGIIIYLLTLGVNLLADYITWLHNLPKDHTQGAILRLIGLIPACIAMGWYWVLLLFSVYWMVFDGLYNIVRGFNWWFTGSDDPNDAITDNFLQTLSLWQHITIKSLLIVCGVVLVLVVK